MTRATRVPESEPARSDFLREELLRPEAYPHAVAAVECRRTLVSQLFFAGERVYKIKQAVDLGYIDTRAAAERRRLCHEEVRLNAALAPGVHLGVVPVVLEADGHLRLGGDVGDGEIVEWAVAMRRLPAESMLASLLERGAIDASDMGAVAELLARFHAEAAGGVGVDAYGTPEGVADCVEENLDQLAPFAREDGVLTAAQLAFLRGRARTFLDDRHELLLRRVAEGRIREGHGDLHAENVCRMPEGFVAFDRLEFNRRFRCLDVANDLAFLCMDLDQRGAPELAGELERAYVERTGDRELGSLMGFYKVYRALVRAKVGALQAAAERDPTRRAKFLAGARRHGHLALGYELPPRLVLMAGLPGTGKSHLAPFLARPLRALLVASDVARKRAAGLEPSASARAAWGEGLYSPAARAQVYDDLLAQTSRALAAGRAVVVDASFAQRELRAPFLAAAADLGVAAAVVEIDVPPAVARERIAARAAHGGDASDADLAVHLRARAAYEPPQAAEGALVLRVDTSRATPEEAVTRYFERVLAAAD